MGSDLGWRGEGPQFGETPGPAAEHDALSQGHLIQSQRDGTVDVPTRLLPRGPTGVEHRGLFRFRDTGDLVLLERLRGQGWDVIPGKVLRWSHRMLQGPGSDHRIVAELGLENPSAPHIEDVLREERDAALRQRLLEVLAQRYQRVDGQGGFDGGSADWFSATVRPG